MSDFERIAKETKQAWDENWQGHEVEKLMEIFEYPRVKKQLDLYYKYLPKDKKILEGGCGLGPYLLYLYKKGYDIVGIDYNEAPVKKIKEFDGSVNVDVMDVRKLTFEDNVFGAYLSLGVIEHFPEGPEVAVSEAYRVLSLGGVFLVQVPIMNIFLALMTPFELIKRNKFLRKIMKREAKVYYWQQYFKADKLKEILEDVGFEIVEIKPMDHEHSIISFSKIFRDKNTYDGANFRGLAFSRFCEKYLPWLTAANMILVAKKGSK